MRDKKIIELSHVWSAREHDAEYLYWAIYTEEYKRTGRKEGRMQEPAPNKDSTLGIVVVPAIVAVIAGRRHKT